jgi:hypothetical protein
MQLRKTVPVFVRPRYSAPALLSFAPLRAFRLRLVGITLKKASMGRDEEV